MRCRRSLDRKRLLTIAARAGDLDLDALAELQGVCFAEGEPDGEDPRIGGTAGVFGAGLAGHDDVGDLLDGRRASVDSR